MATTGKMFFSQNKYPLKNFITDAIIKARHITTQKSSSEHAHPNKTKKASYKNLIQQLQSKHKNRLAPS